MIFDLNMQPVNEFISGLEAGHHISFVPEIRTADRITLTMPELRRMTLTVVARWFDANDDLKEYAIDAWFTEV